MSRIQPPKSLLLRALSLAGALCLFLFLPSLRGSAASNGAATASGADGDYIGSKKCENCHNAEASGNQYGAWKEAHHSKAFETLLGDEAKKIAAGLGIADPSKSEKCLKCHVTAFGLDKKRIKKSFEPKEGVGCESCHGPGDDHAKARFRAANEEEEDEGFGDEEAAPSYTELPAGEIDSSVGVATCVQCHNEESPTYKPFCYFHRAQKVRHINPLKPRTEAEKAALKGCDCEDEYKCEHVCTDECRGIVKEQK
jgi:hypothetical protein